MAGVALTPAPAPVHTRAEWSERIGRCWDAAQAAVFDLGQCLIDAKAALPHGEFEAMIRADLPFESSTARKFMAIARDDRLRDLKRSPGNVLPGEWTTLYAISRLDDEALETAIDKGEISPDMTRAAVKRIAAGGFEAPPVIEDGCRVEDLRALIAAGRKFGAISADIPWPYQTYSDKGKGRAPDRHYSTQDLDDVKALPVAELAADDCVLFLWVVGWIRPTDREAIGDAWGFEYKSDGFDWFKLNASREKEPEETGHERAPADPEGDAGAAEFDAEALARGSPYGGTRSHGARWIRVDDGIDSYWRLSRKAPRTRERFRSLLHNEPALLGRSKGLRRRRSAWPGTTAGRLR